MPRPIVNHETSQYDDRHEYSPDCACEACRARSVSDWLRHTNAKPVMHLPLRFWLLSLALSGAIILAGATVIAHAKHGVWRESGGTLTRGNTIKPAVAKARAECPNDSSIPACRAALIHAYAALAWTRKQRLHLRHLSSASALTPIEVGRALADRRGWSDHQFACLITLWNRESGWQISDPNPYSQADGIPQANPAWKMATAGADWRTNPATQIRWGLGYITARYGSACNALGYSNAFGYY